MTHLNEEEVLLEELSWQGPEVQEKEKIEVEIIINQLNDPQCTPQKMDLIINSTVKKIRKEVDDKSLECLLNYIIMLEPVTIGNSQTSEDNAQYYYEKESLENWMKTCADKKSAITHPFTRQVFTQANVITNEKKKKQIEAFYKKWDPFFNHPKIKPNSNIDINLENFNVVMDDESKVERREVGLGVEQFHRYISKEKLTVDREHLIEIIKNNKENELIDYIQTHQTSGCLEAILEFKIPPFHHHTQPSFITVYAPPPVDDDGGKNIVHLLFEYDLSPQILIFLLQCIKTNSLFRSQFTSLLAQHDIHGNTPIHILCDKLSSGKSNAIGCYHILAKAYSKTWPEHLCIPDSDNTNPAFKNAINLSTKVTLFFSHTQNFTFPLVIKQTCFLYLFKLFEQELKKLVNGSPSDEVIWAKQDFMHIMSVFTASDCTPDQINKCLKNKENIKNISHYIGFGAEYLQARKYLEVFLHNFNQEELTSQILYITGYIKEKISEINEEIKDLFKKHPQLSSHSLLESKEISSFWEVSQELAGASRGTRLRNTKISFGIFLQEVDCCCDPGVNLTDPESKNLGLRQ